MGILENMTFKISLACDQFLLDTIINCFVEQLIRGGADPKGSTGYHNHDTVHFQRG